ncbi:MAG: sporulation integral membrane protein YlbJ [Firmicutes bacterium]|nr:sporulation integral membrane protein YlbJ [Bacillota bacterium]
MLLFPEEAFDAALNGLSVWWNIVFPALLPFFIFSQVLIGLGVVHFLGILLEPVMRPVFNIPGTGSFVMAMGLASGFPIGAVLTGKLRQQQLCSKVEAERLISFVNTADPLFMFGAVAVGMLKAPHTGFIIAAAHYLSSISLGFIMRFYKRGQHLGQRFTGDGKRKQKNIFTHALQAMVEARKKDSRPIGRLLGDSIKDSVNTLLLVGGFIILFSVIIRMLDLAGAVTFLALGFSRILSLAGLDTALSPAFVSGLFEIDLGCQLIGTVQGVTVDQKVIAVSAIIAWSGLSVHAQVASLISSTDISILPYVCARVLHALLAGLYCLLLLGPLGFPVLLDSRIIPVFQQTVPLKSLPHWYAGTVFLGKRFLVIIAVLLVVSMLVYCFEKLKIKTKKTDLRRY